MNWKESIVSLEDYHGINGGLWFFMQLKIQWTVACKSTLEMCKEACNSSLSFLSLFDIILRRQIKHEWIFFWHCHYYYSSSDIGFRRSSLFTKGIGTISRRIYRKSGVPRPFFNKQDIEKDLTKKEKYKFTKNKIPRFPQQKIRPNVLNARKDACF